MANDFKAWAVGTGPNVLTQVEYEALIAALANKGFRSGIADSKAFNKVFRQATTGTAALAQIIEEADGLDVSDTGSVAAFVSRLKAALVTSADLGLPGAAARIGSGVQAIPTIAALRNAPKTSAAKVAEVVEYYASSKGGGGEFVLDAADNTTTDNGYTTIVGTDGARWKRVVNRHDLDPLRAGARFNGTDDDLDAVDLTISLAAPGAIVRLPNSLGAVTDTINIDKAIQFEGVDKLRSGFYAIGFPSDKSILNWQGTTLARLNNCGMRKMALWSNNNLARGMTLTWVNKSNFEDIYFYQLYRGFVGDHAWSNNFKNASTYAITEETALLGIECNNMHFDRVEFRGANGMRVTGNCAGLKFTSSNFEGITSRSGYGCLLAPTAGATISGVVFEANYFESIKGTAISCAGADPASVRGLVAKGNYFFGGRTLIYGGVGDSPQAMILTNLDGFQISANLFLDWQNWAIFRDGTEQNGSVENNPLVLTPALTNSSNQMSRTVRVSNNTYGRREEYSATVPTSGTYAQGDFVWNLAPSLDANSMCLIGWSRLTTGANHVVGTDWARVYGSQLSPAV